MQSVDISPLPRLFWLAVSDWAPLGLAEAMRIESRWDPTATNPTSRAYGLIQWMPGLLRAYGVTPLDLPDALSQVAIIRRYLHGVARDTRTRLSDWDRVSTYMAVFWPIGVGKVADDAFLVAQRGEPAYAQNAGLDVDRDGRITRGDIRALIDRIPAYPRIPEDVVAVPPTVGERIAAVALDSCWCGRKRNPARLLEVLGGATWVYAVYRGSGAFNTRRVPVLSPDIGDVLTWRDGDVTGAAVMVADNAAVCNRDGTEITYWRESSYTPTPPWVSGRDLCIERCVDDGERVGCV